MIPIVSCLQLLGKCRYCGEKFGFSHALLELFAGIVAVGSLLIFTEIRSFLDISSNVKSVGLLVFYGILFTLLLIIALYDRKQKTLPGVPLLLTIVVSFGSLAYSFYSSQTIISLWAPLIVAAPYLFLFFITLGRAVGFGDVILFACVGALLGADKGIFAFLVALWLGTIVSIALLFFKKVTARSSIGFAPFIVLGFLVALFTDFGVSELIEMIRV